MHISRQWLLPHLLPAAIVAVTLSSLPACAQASEPSIPDPISLQEIRQEEFEPAVGEQIRLAYEQALHNTSDAEPAGRLGMILQCYGKYEPAEICYRRACGLAPHTFRWIYYLGNIEAWLGKNQDAVNYVREALTLDGSYNPARVRLGQLLFESGDTQQSRQVFEESIRRNPRLAAAHLGLGRVLAASGAWPAPFQSYQRSSGIFQN